MVLSQSHLALDAAQLREACVALLVAAKQLLEKTQTTAARNREDQISSTVDLPGSFFAANQEPSLCTSSGGSSEASLTPADSAMWYDGVDVLSLDSEWRSDCDFNVACRSDNDTGFHCASDRIENHGDTLHDDGLWPGIHVDEWPCFPG